MEKSKIQTAHEINANPKKGKSVDLGQTSLTQLY